MGRTDQELLEAFGEDSDQDAFAELVRRHLPAVHASALRQLLDPHLAKDVSQVVFCRLALRWRRLAKVRVLGAWLHADTRLVSLQTLRSERRRTLRDRQAVDAMPTMPQIPTTDDWEEIRPCLDAALASIPARDRDALFLRYFEHRSHREIAEVLGVAEDAARMRLTRALESLRRFLSRRGITTTSAALGNHLVARATPQLLPGISEAVLQASMSTSTSLALQTPAFVLAGHLGIAMSHAPTLVTGIALAALACIPLLRLHRTNLELAAQGRELRTELASLRAASAATDEQVRRLTTQLAERPWVIAKPEDSQRQTPRSATDSSGDQSSPIAEIPATPPTAEPSVEAFLRLAPEDQARLLASGRTVPLPLTPESAARLARQQDLAAKVREPLESLEEQPGTFASFQAAYIEHVAGIEDPQRTTSIRSLLESTYRRAHAEGLTAASRPATDPTDWGLRRDALDRAATRAVQNLLTPAERLRFDRAFLGVMGIDLGIGDGARHRFVNPDGGIVFPSEPGSAGPVSAPTSP